MTIAWEDPRRALGRHGLRAKRGFSQNFLVSQSVVERIALAAAPTPGALVVELGPGLGTLTRALVGRGARVLGIEADPDMLRVLEADLVPSGAVEVVHGDAAALDLASVAAREGGPVYVAGNLPYAITGAIMRGLVEQAQHVKQAVVMVQREVRDRLLAPPGGKAYGALTVFVQARFDVSSVCLVPPGAFHPPPKVASAVVRLVPLEAPRAEETPAFRAVVRAVFDARRKTLRNALSRNFPTERVEAVMRELGLDSNVRGETLSVEQLAEIARALAPSLEATST